MTRPTDIKILGPEYTQDPWNRYYIIDETFDGDENGHIIHEAATKHQAETIAQYVRDRIDEYTLWRDDGEGQDFIEEEIL